jgi:Fe-S cluster biogenesis protein NfuA
MTAPRREEANIVRPEVEKVLETIRPALQADGGDVELVDVVGGVVKVRLKGACNGCPMAQMTLKGGIEAALKERIPAVERVESV